MTARKPKPLRVAGYIRVSHVGGREGDSFMSPDVQREKIEAWAGYRGNAIVRWYTDLDQSGRRMSRPEFERMVRDAKAGDFDVVAVYRLTRFARTVKGAAKALDDLESHGVGLVSCTEDIDTTTTQGKLLRNILLALAEFESDRIGEESRNTHAMRRARGIANVTRPLFGYTVNAGTIDGVNETEAEGVRLAFRLRASGHGYRSIAAELQRQGFRPVKAASGRGFGDSTLRKLLRNPHYAGLLRLDDGELAEARHEAIVERELFEQVQTTMRSGALPRSRVSLLSGGLIVCSGCGLPMWRGHGAKPGQRAYRCSAQWAGVKCERPVTVRVDYIEPLVEERFLARFDAKRMPKNGRLPTRKKRPDPAARLRARVEELTAGLDRIGEAHFVKGTLPAVEYGRLLDDLTGQRERAVTRLKELTAATPRMPDELATGNVLDVFPKLPLEVKQRALRVVVDRVVVHPANGGKRSQPPTGGGRGGNRFDASRVQIVWSDR